MKIEIVSHQETFVVKMNHSSCQRDFVQVKVDCQRALAVKMEYFSHQRFDQVKVKCFYCQRAYSWVKDELFLEEVGIKMSCIGTFVQVEIEPFSCQKVFAQVKI